MTTFRLLRLLGFILAALILPNAASAQTPNGPSAAAAACAPAKSPSLASIADSLCRGQLLTAFASLTNQAFRLPKPLTIVGAECGRSNASFAPDKAVIFICYELGAEIFHRISQEKRLDANTRGEIAAGALFFVFAHELGHALINFYNLPVLGREEDAADQIATFLLIVMAGHKPNVAQYWTVGAHWFFAKRPLFFKTGHFADEHSLNPQRQFNIACWIYGSDPNRYTPLAQYARLPRERAQRCPQEYQQMLNAAKQMLSSYINDPRNQVQPGDQYQDTSMAQRAAACHNEAQRRTLSSVDRESFIQQCYQNNGVVVRRTQ